MSLIVELNEISNNFWEFFDSQGQNGSLIKENYQKTYEDGLFDTKTKRLMAMCASVVSGCKGCILGQTDKAIKNGATTDEILEVCSVAVSLGGTSAASNAALVMRFLKEKGMLQS